MKKNLKLTIAALSVLLVMAIATTVASFSRADEPTRVNPLAGADGDDITEYDRNTNIDYIIMNSHTTPSKEEIDMFGDTSKYHIVELGFGGQSDFGKMCENGDFEEYVLNGNKSAAIEQLMNADKIDYTYKNISEVGEKDEDTLQTIARADFIYVSNVGGKNSASNDIGEELYNLLHTYAIGDYKPLIIDSPNAKSGQGEAGGGGGNGGSGASADSTFNTVVKDYFSKQGIYYNTYEWNSSKTADKFLQGGIGDTYYVGINSRTAQNGWKTLYEKPSDELSDEDKNNPDKLVEAKVAKILVVSGDGSTGALYNNLMGTPEPATTLYTNDGTKTEPYVPDCPMYVAKDDFKKAYSTRYKYRPGYVEVETAKIDDIGTVSLDGYDLVIFEASCSNIKIGAAAYDRMVAAMKSKMYILYDSSLSTVAQTQPSGNTGNTGTGTGNAGNIENSKYEELYYMVASTDGQPLYPNIMPTNNSTVASMANSKSASICRPIADLINNSSYRGIGGPKGSSTTFTVLEIQPAYPIDVELAEKQGIYYKSGADMAVSGSTKEQIPAGKEYYAWELSEAKIAAALKMNYDDVTVVHMSIEELAANHTELVGKYDMIYIGNNRSALEKGSYSYTSKGESLVYKGFSFLGSGGEGYKDVSANRTDIFFSLDNYNSRDLSKYNLEQLNEYAKEGMPIVISKKLTEAYGVNDGVLEKNSRMREFLNKNNSKSNVLMDFDVDKTVQDNGGGLGETLTGYVTVFESSEGEKLRELYTLNTHRLVLAVTSRPPQYNLYDKSTKLTTTKLEYKYDSNSSKCTSKLYIDHDGNGAFDETPVASGKEGYLKYDLSSYKGGLINWKLEISDGNSKAYTTGQTYVKPNSDKQDVRVLQILPDMNAYWRNYGPQGLVSLIFCTECQRALMPITYNPMVSNPWSDKYNSYSALYMGSDNTSNFGNGGQYGSPVNRNTGYIQYQQANPVYIGQHEHKFGIVKYGSSEVYGAEGDDWDWNLADELSDMYNFHIDVMYSREYEALDKKIKADYTKYIGNEDELNKSRVAVSTAKTALDTYVNGDYAQLTTDLRTVIADLRDNFKYNNNSYKVEMQRLLDEECYYDFFSSFCNLQAMNAALDRNNKQMTKAYEAWARGTDKKIALTKDYMNALYKYNFLKSNGEDWISQADGEDVPEAERVGASYSSLVFGAAENFGLDDINKEAAKTIHAYSEKGGQVIMFHECMGRLKDYTIAANLTAAVVEQAGVKSYSDTQMIADSYGNLSFYKYANLKWDKVAFWNSNADYTVIQQVGTNKAVMNNRCAVNTYPFTLSDKLKITGTHPVGFALDTDKMDVTPLYTLSTSSYQNEFQRIYPASPVDGSDNYFIYKSGNFYYCGAGHSKVTGRASNNNDERRLYINIICSSVTNSSVIPEDPSIDVFDHGTTEKDIEDGKGNDKIKPTDDGYTYAIEEDVDYPEFTFKATSAEGTKITSVSVYYKLDSKFESMKDEDAIKAAMAYNKSVDKMIADSSTKIGSSTLLDIIANGGLADIDEASCPGLKLSADMFTPYGGNYTYIVIEVKDNKGGTTYQKIKVTKKPHLFDLT